jgi:hypothetical protein
MKILRAAVIGLGIGERHIFGYNADDRCHVVAICDFNREKLYEEARQNNRGLWAMDPSSENEGFDYRSLKCIQQYKGNNECCKKSVRIMEENKYLLAPRQHLKDSGCPEGFEADRIKCLGSYIWCAPVK